MGYALRNLFADLESFDPPSTPALEVRVIPIHNVYVKSMVTAAVRAPFFTKPNRLGPAVQRNTRKYFGEWIYSRQERLVCGMYKECENGCKTNDAS